MTTQREKDKEQAYILRRRDTGETYHTGFADGAEYGRKDLARRVLEPFQQNPDKEFPLWVQPIVQLCLAILRGDER